LREITNEEFERIRSFIKQKLGINLSNEKKSLIHSRLGAIIQEKGFDNFSQYFDYLLQDKADNAIIQFVDKITTNHTYFMRETDHFDYFRDTVLPYIYENHSQNNDLRLWCAGCSSGEESYTLEMIIQDFFQDKPAKWDTQILATDISSTILNKAIQGVYPSESLRNLPKRWINNYFRTFDTEHSIIRDEIKKLVIYRKYNLMEERFPFQKLFQTIFCRNVMIYFDSATRDRLVNKFYDATVAGGFLFIGHSESLNHMTTKYKYIKPAVYRKV
jgi:chemotaxis protein methyltransferase CheR